MTGQQHRPVFVSLVWTVVGAVALVAVTVGITVSVASLRTADRTIELVTQLRHANEKIDQLSAESTATREQADAEREQAAIDERRAAAERNQLRRQARVTQAQLLAVLAYLRAHGIDIPPEIVTPPASPRPRPKAAGPRGPNPSTTSSSSPQPSPSPSPRPLSGTTTGPTTGPGITDLTCLLAPMLCP